MFTALKLCEPPETCMTASVRPCVGRTAPRLSGRWSICAFISPVIWPWRSGLHQTMPLGPERVLAQLVDRRMVVAGDLVGKRQVRGVEDAHLGAEVAQEPRGLLGGEPRVGALPQRAVEQQDARRVVVRAEAEPGPARREARVEGRQVVGIGKRAQSCHAATCGRQLGGCRGREPALRPAERDVHQPDQHRHLDQRADDRGERGAVLMPKTATATAIASSKLLLAAVNAMRRRLRVVGPELPAHPEADAGTSPRSRSAAGRRSQHVERQLQTILSPLRLNITTIVNSSATSVIGLIRGMNARLVPVPRPSALSSTKRVSIPARNGMPR